MHLRNNYIAIIITSLIILSLTACTAATPTEDPVLKITQVASTVLAQLTQSAALTPSATPTLEPTATPTATQIPPTETPSGATEIPAQVSSNGNSSGANNSHFDADVTVPDGTTFYYNQKFVKTWQFKNTGSTTWTTDYQLVMIGGNLYGDNHTYKVNLPNSVAPGEHVKISVNFTAPVTSGTYTSMWKLVAPDGTAFGEYCSMTINAAVSGATVASTSTSVSAATSTPLP